jgi:hypothetical protein
VGSIFHQRATASDEYSTYIEADPDKIHSIKGSNPIAWWDNNKEDFPTLHQFALDTLAIPATAADCERAFSSGRKLISPERNRLSDDIIEATECLKAWWDSGIIKQLA